MVANGNENRVKTAVAGEYLYTSNSKLDSATAYVIISGEVKIVLSKTDGSNTVLATFGPRSIMQRYLSVNGVKAPLCAQASKPTSYIVTSTTALAKSTGGISNSDTDLQAEAINVSALSKSGIDTAGQRGIPEGIAPEELLNVHLPELADSATYLYPKELICPVCEQKFESIQIRRSKLKTLAIEHDSRVRYRDFEPMRYSIIVCPHCSYANSAMDFENLAEVAKTRLRPYLIQFSTQKLFFYPYIEDREIFAAYYQAINCLEKIGGLEAKVARMWLSLSWLYDDADEKEASDTCSRHALAMFERSFYNTVRETSIEQDQRFNLMLGHLYLRNDKPKLAAKHYYAAINRRNGTKVLNDMAEDKLQLAKEAVRKMSPEDPSTDPDE